MVYYRQGERVEYLKPDKSYFIPDDIGFGTFLCYNNMFSTEEFAMNEIWKKVYVEDKYRHSSFIDIGANVGTYTIELAPYFEHTYAFEPDIHIYNILCGNVALHNLSYNTTLINKPLSDKVETVTFSKFNELGGESLCVSEGDKRSSTFLNMYGNVTGIQSSLMETVTLDSYGLDNVGLIKVDVEGFELNVLKGATETILKSGNPILLVESWDVQETDSNTVREEKESLRKELFGYLESIGYNNHKRLVNDLFMFTV